MEKPTPGSRDKPAPDSQSDAGQKEPISQGGPVGVSKDADEPSKDGASSTTRSAPPQGPSA